MGLTYLLDSYALVAHFGAGEPAFRKYVAPGALVSLFSLLETYDRLMETGGAEAAEHLHSVFLEHYRVATVGPEEVPHIARLRFQGRRRRKRWSYADAANLYLARREHARLVTGDAALKGEPGVEFVAAARRGP